jgi:hypothetical protein
MTCRIKGGSRRHAAIARRTSAGYPVLNEVVLNQVPVVFGDAAMTRRVIAEVQGDGTCWCGVTERQGHTAMRRAAARCGAGGRSAP